MSALLLIGLGATAVAGATLVAERAARAQSPRPDYPPDPPRGRTGYRQVDRIMGELHEASAASGIPLGVLVGWVARESRGKIGTTTRRDERGYFQITPEESARLGLDHRRLSSDPVYSINGGLLLVAEYGRLADAFGVAPRGSEYHYLLTKLGHTLGSGATRVVVEGAKAVGQAGSWEVLRRHALENEARYRAATRRSPARWFPLVDDVYRIGAPYGFGEAQTTVLGAAAFKDIPDPLDVLDGG